MYELDPNAAKEADQMGGRIDTTGKYIGAFTRAEQVTSRKGTQGVEFTFKSNDGPNADFLTLWTQNTDGKQLHGYKVLMAIMTCLKVRSLTPTSQTVEKYDRDLGRKAEVEATVFPELMNKPIGVLLQREEYESQQGELKSKMNIVAPFEPEGGFTASEILDQATQPVALEKMVLQLRDRPLKKPTSGVADNPPVESYADDFDPDIPF